MMKAQTTFDKYAFIFPKNESEIVREGKILHHVLEIMPKGTLSTELLLLSLL